MSYKIIIDKFSHVINKLFDNGILIRITAFAAMFITPLLQYIEVIIALIFLDMLTSIYVQYKDNIKEYQLKECPKTIRLFMYSKVFWQTINPQRIPVSIEKIVGYSIALIVCAILDNYIINGMSPKGELYKLSLTNAVFILIIASESISILRNLGKITNNTVFKQIEKLIIKKYNLKDYPETEE